MCETSIVAQDEIDELLAMTDDQLLRSVQKATFRYFWDFAHPVSGLIRERETSGELVTMGGSGFGIMAILVGIENDFITREQGTIRTLKILRFLQNADRFHGAFPHWMNGSTGRVIPFSPRDDGGDLVETAFLMQGILTARAFFDQNSEAEQEIQTLSTGLWEDVEWNWYRKQTQDQLFWHWSPNQEFDINLPIRGWNETMIAYILAIAAPTQGVPADLYHRGWAGPNYRNGGNHYGYKLEVGRDTGGPLFFTHYSFLGFDPRGKRDAYANYFFQGVNQTRINRAWCIENPKNYLGYGADCWGLTASDDPDGYKAHAPNLSNDNGTITPSAGISSIVYTPQESIGLIRSLLAKHREKVWGRFGFYDAFNESRNWFTQAYLAIDQGPIICMIENHKTGLLWDLFMSNPEITEAMDKIGFVQDAATTALEQKNKIFELSPNPTSQSEVRLHTLGLNLSQKSISLYSLDGRFISEIDLLDDRLKMPANLDSGIYLLVIEGSGFRETHKLSILAQAL